MQALDGHTDEVFFLKKLWQLKKKIKELENELNHQEHDEQYEIA